MKSTESRASLIAQAEGLLRNNPFTKEHSAKFDALMSLANAFQESSEDRFRSASVGAHISEQAEAAEKEFRNYVRTGKALRTYVPMNEGTGSQGGYFVPEQWRSEYQSRLVSATGLLAAGATLAELKTGRKYLSFLSDDTGSEAEILAENTQLNDGANPVNPVAAVYSPTLNKYATSTVVSNEELVDAAFDIDGYLQKLFAVRVSRKANNYMTADGTNGIIGKLTVGATTAAAVPSLAELAAMQSPAQIDPAYLEADSQPCYMISPALRATLLAQTGSGSGNKLYPELSEGKLLGFPVCINVDMSASAGSVAATFGSVKRAVFVHSTPAILVRSKELQAEFDRTYFALFHRLGAVVTDVNALTALQLHS